MNDTMENLSYVPKRLPNTAPNGNTEGIFWHTFVPFVTNVYISDFQISYLNARSVNNEDVIQYSFLFRARESNFQNIQNVKNNLLPYFETKKASKNKNLMFNVSDFYSNNEKMIRLDIELVNINNMFMALGEIPTKDLESKEFKDNKTAYLEVIQRIFTMLSIFYADRDDLTDQLKPSFELDVQENIFTTEFDILLSYQYSRSSQLKNKQNNVNLNRSEREVLSRGFIEWLFAAEDPLPYINRTSGGVNKSTFFSPGQNVVNVNYSNHNVNVNRQDFNRGMAREANRNNKADTATPIVDLNAPSADVANKIGNIFAGIHGDNLTEFQRVQKCAQEVSNFLNNMKYDPNMMAIDKMTTDFQNRLDDLNNERKRLQQENEELKKKLEDCEYIKGVATRNAEDIARFMPVDDLNDDDLNDDDLNDDDLNDLNSNVKSNKEVEFPKKGIQRPNARDPIRKEGRETYVQKQLRSLAYDRNARNKLAVDIRKKSRQSRANKRRNELQEALEERRARIEEIGTDEQKKEATKAVAQVVRQVSKVDNDIKKVKLTTDQLLEKYRAKAEEMMPKMTQDEFEFFYTTEGRKKAIEVHGVDYVKALAILLERKKQAEMLQEEIQPIAPAIDKAVEKGDLKELNKNIQNVHESIENFKASMQVIDEVAENNDVDIDVEIEIKEEELKDEVKELDEDTKKLDEATNKFKNKSRVDPRITRMEKIRERKKVDKLEKFLEKRQEQLKQRKLRNPELKRKEGLKRTGSSFKDYKGKELQEKYKIRKEYKPPKDIPKKPAKKRQALPALPFAQEIRQGKNLKKVGTDGNLGLIAGSLIGDPMEKRSLIEIVAEDHLAEAAKRNHKRLVIFLYTEAGDSSQCCLTYNNDFLDTVCFYYDSYNNNLILLNTDMLIGLTTERLKQAGLTDLTHVDDILLLEPEKV